MQKLICTIFFLVLCISLPGNSMSYDGEGNQIVPLENNPIQLKKEILNLVWNNKEKKFDIDVEFTFYNPQKEMNLNVGFFNPVSPFSTMKKEKVYNFSIICNDKKLNYTILDRDEIKSPEITSLYNGPFVVYQFISHFKKGYNIVKHNYSFGGNSDLQDTRTINYILKTGLNWANSTIEDFELYIKVPPRTIITFMNNLDNTHSWKFRGPTKLFEFNEYKYIYTISGEATFKAKNFIPQNNLKFQFNPDLNYSIYMNKWNFKGQHKDDYWYSDLFFVDGMYMSLLSIDLSKYTTNQLKVLKNTLFAMEGYRFEDPKVYKFFDQFIWYIPDKSIAYSEDILPADRKAFF